MSADALIPAPPVVRCRNPDCRKVCRNGTTDGYGPKCARDRGLLPPRAPRPAKPVRAMVDDGPDLLDLIEEGVDE